MYFPNQSMQPSQAQFDRVQARSEQRSDMAAVGGDCVGHEVHHFRQFAIERDLGAKQAP
ncbi:unnamed protein product [marine sediment metagenome]|uniref:Uncharacterized protein n=1 Tax=marine sediment metagenome TaxID=412755 RepID=X1NAK6_9ZZZZ